MGRWSAAHRKTAIFGWIGFVVAALFIGGSLGMSTIKDGHDGAGSSGRADALLADQFPQPAAEQVLIQARHGKLNTNDPRVRAAVSDVASRLSALPQVKSVKSPFVPSNRGQISKDGRSLVVQFNIRGKADTAQDRVQRSLDAVAQAQRAHPSLRIEQFGDASAAKAFDSKLSADFQRSEFLSLPITLAILILAFGALVAAGLPVLLAVSSVAATMGLTMIVSQLTPMGDSVAEVILLVGMAVGVDYSLFYMRREREERAAGASDADALQTAASTSGRAVLVSGVTVMVAMAGMLLAGDSTFTALGIGAILVVAVAMVGSVTVIPALLSGSGKWLERGRIPFIGKRMNARRVRDMETGSRGWNFILDRVLRFPKTSAALATALLLVLAMPALHMHTSDTGTEAIPRNLDVMKTYDRMQAAFPGGEIPAEVVVKAKDVTSPKFVAAVNQLQRDALATGQVKSPIDTTVSPNKHVLQVSLPIVGTGTDKASNEALSTLRNDVVPKFEHRVGTKAYVTGMTAGSKDWNTLMKARWPIVFTFVLGLAFVLLLITFRSLVIPIKAIILNLLSVGAAYGVLTWVFQDGHGEGLLGFKSTHAITSWLPMFLFVILFGLSMDYHVFIVSRIREAFDRGMKTEDAVAHGIKATAGTVTSAAMVMVVVFGMFATESGIEMKELGIGLAAAILIDATIVRAVLLPAAMKLLGNWNWYLPGKLGWLPNVSHEPAAQPAAA